MALTHGIRIGVEAHLKPGIEYRWLHIRQGRYHKRTFRIFDLVHTQLLQTTTAEQITTFL